MTATDMTKAQAAVALGLSPTQVLRLVEQGRLDATKPQREWWITAASVEAYNLTRRKPGRQRKETGT